MQHQKKKRQEQNKKDEGKQAAFSCGFIHNCMKWSVPKMRVQMRAHSFASDSPPLIIAGSQVFWLTHRLFDCQPWQRRCWSSEPLPKQIEWQWSHILYLLTGIWIHMLDIMDTSNTHTWVFVMQRAPINPTCVLQDSFTLRVALGHGSLQSWVTAHKVSRDTSSPMCTLTQLQLNMLHIVSVCPTSTGHMWSRCHRWTIHLTQSLSKVTNAHLLPWHLCHWWDSPSQPTLSWRAQVFGLTSQLLSVKTGMVPPTVGLEGLSITFGTNSDKSHKGQRSLWSPVKRHTFISHHAHSWTSLLLLVYQLCY